MCDLDGVVWTGRRPIPGASDAVAALRAAGWRVAFLTNNSSRRIDDVRAQLADMGVATEAADVLSSARRRRPSCWLGISRSGLACW